MAEDLAKLQVVIEATNAPLKKELKKAQDMVKEASGNMEKQSSVKAFSGEITKAQQLAKKMRQIVKEAQVQAGTKVYTEEYKTVQKEADNAKRKLRQLREEEKALEQMGQSQGMSEQYQKVSDSAKKAQRELDALKKKMEELEQDGKEKQVAPKFAKVDGEYRVEKEKLENLKQEYENRRKNRLTMQDVDSDGKLINIEEELSKSLDRVEALEAKIKELRKEGKEWQPTEAAIKLSDQMEQASEKLGKYQSQMTQMRADGVDRGTDAWIKNQKAINQATQEQAKYQNMKANMENAGTDMKGTKITGISGMLYEIKAFKERLKANLKEAFEGTKVGKGWGDISRLLGMISKEAERASTKIKKCSGAAASLIHRFSNGISVAGRFAKGLLSLGRGARNTAGGFQGGLKGLLMYGLGIRSLFALVNRLRSVLTEGMNNLAQYNDSTNGSLSMLMSSLTQLKNALATAFAPILNAAAPMLNLLIQKVTAAVTALGQLFASLTGQSGFVAAKRVNQDYAKSLNSNADSAKKANKENKKLQNTLFGFDQINKLNDNSDSDDNADTSTGGGLTPADMFESVPLDSKVSDFAKKLKDAWKNADFTEIGQIVGTKLNDALNRIPWGPIQNTSRKVGKSIGTFISGFVEVPDLGTNIGKTIAEAVNTGVGGINAFLDNTRWDSVGKFIGDGLNGAADTVDRRESVICMRRSGMRYLQLSVKQRGPSSGPASDRILQAG